jgi:hypothetical protein
MDDRTSDHSGQASTGVNYQILKVYDFFVAAVDRNQDLFPILGRKFLAIDRGST